MSNITGRSHGIGTRAKFSGYNRNDALFFIRFLSLIIVAVIYIVLFRVLNITEKNKMENNEVFEEKMFKLVDIQEYIPPAPPKPVPQVKEVPKEEVKIIEKQVEASEKIVETKEEIKEKEPEPVANPDDEFLPQHKVSAIPVVPGNKLLRRIDYPKDAYKNGIEGVVYLELFIDKKGNIKKIKVLKNPGYGFAEAAIKAFEGIVCQPAVINGETVSVRFRYPVRFSLR